MRCAGEHHEAQFTGFDDALAMMNVQAGHLRPAREGLFTDDGHLLIGHVAVGGVLDRDRSLLVVGPWLLVGAHLPQEDLVPADIRAGGVLGDALGDEGKSAPSRARPKRRVA